MSSSENLGEIQLTDDSGVSKNILTPGEGSSPVEGMEVQVHYTGTLLNGSKFDSSLDRDTPFKFTLGKGSVIKGWEIGVQSMKKGEKCELFCTAPYAYGEKGSGDKIPGNSTLKFEIELLSFSYETVTADGMVKKRMITKGDGYDTPNDGAICKVIITASTANNKENPFIKKSETEITIDIDNEPSGLNTVLKKMKKGEKSLFFISPGEHHFDPELLPKNVSGSDELVYEIELKSFTNKKETWEMKFEEKFEEAKVYRERGNKFFKLGKLRKATNQYEHGVSALENEDFTDDDDDTDNENTNTNDNEEGEGDGDGENKESTLSTVNKNDAKNVLIALYGNLSLIHYKNKDFTAAGANCDKILKLDSSNVKALYRRSQVREANADWDMALEDIEKAIQLSPDSALFAKRKLGIYKKRGEQQKNLNAMYARMTKGFGAK